jgi:hypothetical protein
MIARQRAQLILRERLGRIEIECARRFIGENRLDDRNVVAERLAARGAGDDDHVLAARACAIASAWWV